MENEIKIDVFESYIIEELSDWNARMKSKDKEWAYISCNVVDELLDILCKYREQKSM